MGCADNKDLGEQWGAHLGGLRPQPGSAHRTGNPTGAKAPVQVIPDFTREEEKEENRPKVL